MFALNTHLMLPRRVPSCERHFVSKTLFRIVGPACIAACTWTAVALPADAAAAAAQAPGTSTFTLVPARSIVVANLNNSGPGSLRAAIEDANAGPPGTPTVIGFSVNGIITLASSLPAISSNVTIDATSAPLTTAPSKGPPIRIGLL